MQASQSDALVFFGITGDLAYKKIFPSLQAMIRRGHLDVPVIGVANAGWNLDQFRARARDRSVLMSASDWPLMQGKLFPAGIDWSQGLVHAMTGDPFLVHFIHRWWAWVVVAVLIVMGRKLRGADARPASVAIHSAFGLQILLGIATVMTGVELWLAVMHQLTGALLVAATVWGAHGLGRRG